MEVFYQVGEVRRQRRGPDLQGGRRVRRRDRRAARARPPVPDTGADPKWRFFWRIGGRPAEGGFEDLNAKPVCPAHFPQWAETMVAGAAHARGRDDVRRDGRRRLRPAARRDQRPHAPRVAPARADGLGPGAGHANRRRHRARGIHNDVRKSARERERARARARCAPSPATARSTAALTLALSRADPPKQLNLLTIHGKSRYPGLHVWTKDGTKMRVAIPPGCLLVQVRLSSRARAERPNRPENTDSRENDAARPARAQAGMQMERLTGGGARGHARGRRPPRHDRGRAARGRGAAAVAHLVDGFARRVCARAAAARRARRRGEPRRVPAHHGGRAGDERQEDRLADEDEKKEDASAEAQVKAAEGRDVERGGARGKCALARRRRSGANERTATSHFAE